MLGPLDGGGRIRTTMAVGPPRFLERGLPVSPAQPDVPRTAAGGQNRWCGIAAGRPRRWLTRATRRWAATAAPTTTMTWTWSARARRREWRRWTIANSSRRVRTRSPELSTRRAAHLAEVVCATCAADAWIGLGFLQSPGQMVGGVAVIGWLDGYVAASGQVPTRRPHARAVRARGYAEQTLESTSIERVDGDEDELTATLGENGFPATPLTFSNLFGQCTGRAGIRTLQATAPTMLAADLLYGTIREMPPPRPPPHTPPPAPADPPLPSPPPLRTRLLRQPRRPRRRHRRRCRRRRRRRSSAGPSRRRARPAATRAPCRWRKAALDFAIVGRAVAR